MDAAQLRRPALWKRFAQYALVALCTIYVVQFFRANTDALKLAAAVRPSAVVWLIVLNLVSLLLQSCRQRIVLVKVSQRHIPFWRWYQLFVLGTFINRAFPQAGALFRSIRLKAEYGVPYTRYISAYVSFSWLDTAINFITALVVVHFTQPDLAIAGYPARLIIIALIILTLVATPVVGSAILWLRGRVPWFAWAQNRLAEVFEATFATLGDAGYLAKVAATGLLSFALTAVVFQVSFRAFGTDVPWSVLALYCVMMKLSNQIVITPGNMGVREVAYGLLGRLAGVGEGQALLVSILTRLVTTIVVIVMGLSLGGLGFIRKGPGDTASGTQPPQQDTRGGSH